MDEFKEEGVGVGLYDGMGLDKEFNAVNETDAFMVRL